MPVTDEYGRYDLTFDPDDGEPDRFEFWVTTAVADTDRYLIADDGIEAVESLTAAGDGVGHPPKPCSWDGDGNLI